MKTSETWMENHTMELLGSLSDIPANHSAMPGSAEARKMTVISGKKALESLHPQDPLSFWLRMLLGTSHWVSMQCWLTWKVSHTPAGRLLYQLQPRCLTNEDLESGLLPRMWGTPRASEYKDCGPVGSKSQINMMKKYYLCAQVKEGSSLTGKLSPMFCEWLMGYPTGWSE